MSEGPLIQQPTDGILLDETAVCSGCDQITRPVKLTKEIESMKGRVTQRSSHRCFGCNYVGILVCIQPEGAKRTTQRLIHPSELY